MNEFIEVQFRKGDKRLRVRRQLPGGIEFEETDPLERTVGIQFTPSNEITRIRMDSVRRIQGWQPGEFKLNLSVANGSIVLRGANEHALPEGRYGVRLQIEEAKTPRMQTAAVDHDGFSVVQIDVEMDDRAVLVDLTDADEDIMAVLDRSTVNGMPAVDWLEDTTRRPTRQACLLNLMAKLRVPPRAGMPPLLGGILRVFFAASERIYVEAATDLYDACDQLAAEPSRRFYLEGHPTSPTHKRLLAKVAEMGWGPFTEDGLVSFRQEGQPSTQVVVATNVPLAAPLYADIDLDLGNPLQDLAGFVVHMGELISGKSTDHLKLWSKLNKGATKEFLYYRVV